MLTKPHVFGSEIPKWRKSNKPVSLAATHWEEGRPLRNLPARHFCRELLLAARHNLDFFTCLAFSSFQAGHFFPTFDFLVSGTLLLFVVVFSTACHWFLFSVYVAIFRALFSCVFNCPLLLVLLCVFCVPILVFPCVFNLLPVLSTLHCTDNGAWQPWGQAPRHGRTCILSDFLKENSKKQLLKKTI